MCDVGWWKIFGSVCDVGCLVCYQILVMKFYVVVEKSIKSGMFVFYFKLNLK